MRTATMIITPKAGHVAEDEDEDDYVLADGQRLRVPMTAMDAVQRAVAADANLDLHKPGFRRASADAEAEADREYRAMCQRTQEAWCGPQRVEQDTEQAASIARDETIAERDNNPRAACDLAYAEMCARQSSAWKGGAR